MTTPRRVNIVTQTLTMSLLPALKGQLIFVCHLEWLFCPAMCYTDKYEKNMFIMVGKSIETEAFAVRL